MRKKDTKEIITNAFCILWISLLIFICTWAMKLSPIWNGEIPYHRNQYEVMARSLLNGHLFLDIEVEKELLDLENPYDPDARNAVLRVYKWDHAYYKEHYYMYFGIVPTILLFIPYRLITGTDLTTYHATQVFTAFIIIGLFFLFNFMRKKFFPKMPWFVILALGSGLSLASVWYFVTAPALYCTAISGAVCMMIWSYFFYFRAVFDNISFNKKIIFAVFGALFGALAFGCRPPVAMANFAVIPLFFVFLRNNHITKENIHKTILIFLPYVVTGLLLMAYNYARFENPFEFGQSYQLTFYDQHNYSITSNFDISRLIQSFKELFIEYKGFSENFPYLQFNGILFEFPIFILGLACLVLSSSIRKKLKENNIWGFVIFSLISLGIISFFEITMSPIILERYHSDFYFLLAILTFLIIGMFFTESSQRHLKATNTIFALFGAITALSAVLMFFVPNDLNYIQYYPDNKLILYIKKIFPFLQ